MPWKPLKGPWLDNFCNLSANCFHGQAMAYFLSTEWPLNIFYLGSVVKPLNEDEKSYAIFSIKACINLFDRAYRIATQSITRQEENNQVKKRTKNMLPHKIIKNPHYLIQYPILTIFYILIQFAILSIFDNPIEGKCSGFFNGMRKR